MFVSRLQVANIPKKNRKNKSNRNSFQAEPRKSRFASCRANFHHFLQNTTLHGLKYIGDRTITRFERQVFEKLNREHFINQNAFLGRSSLRCSFWF